MLDSGLGDEYWEFACRYAVHKINQDSRAERLSRSEEFLGKLDHRKAWPFGIAGFARTRGGASRAEPVKFLGDSERVRDRFVLLTRDGENRKAERF